MYRSYSRLRAYSIANLCDDVEKDSPLDFEIKFIGDPLSVRLLGMPADLDFPEKDAPWDMRPMVVDRSDFTFFWLSQTILLKRNVDRLRGSVAKRHKSRLNRSLASVPSDIGQIDCIGQIARLAPRKIIFDLYPERLEPRQ